MNAPFPTITSYCRAISGTVIYLRNITLRLGGVEAIHNIPSNFSDEEPRRGHAPHAPLTRRFGPTRGACGARTLRAVAALALLLAAPAAASDVVGEWRDFHGRCRTAVETGEMIDVSGLETREPTLIGEVVDQFPFGVRLEYDPLTTSARTVPTGIWAAPGGRFEMQLLEFVTRPGVRAICEVGVARGKPALTEDEAAALVSAFRDDRSEAVEAGAYEAEEFDSDAGEVREGMVFSGANPRGCPVVVSLTAATGYFRTSAAERAGDPSCGGPSLAEGGLTTTPAELNRRSDP